MIENLTASEIKVGMRVRLAGTKQWRVVTSVSGRDITTKSADMRLRSGETLEVQK